MITDKQIQAFIRASKESSKSHYWQKLDLPNLWLRVTVKNGISVFVYRVSIGNKSTWYTIGEYPAVTLHEANQKAKQLRTMIKGGINPLNQERQEIANRLTVGKIFDIMLDGLISKGGAKQSVAMLNTFKNNYLPLVGNMTMQELTPQIVRERLIDPLIADDKRTTAHTVYLRIKQLAKFAYEREYAPTNVLAKLQNDFFTPNQRMRILNNGEIAEFLRWCNSNDETITQYLKLTLMLGTRLVELLSMRWDNVNLIEETILLTETKNKHDLLIKLPPQALEIFKQLAAVKIGDFVFSNGKKHFSTTVVTIRLNQLINDTKISKFTCHDLRRTFSSKLAELGYNLDLIDAATNHVLQGVRKNYVHTIRLDERYKMLCEWANYLDEVGK